MSGAWCPGTASCIHIHMLAGPAMPPPIHILYIAMLIHYIVCKWVVFPCCVNIVLYWYIYQLLLLAIQSFCCSYTSSFLPPALILPLALINRQESPDNFPLHHICRNENQANQPHSRALADESQAQETHPTHRGWNVKRCKCLANKKTTP